MSPASLGIFIGLAGGCLRAVIGFAYKKAKNRKTRFIPWKFIITLAECSVAGLVLGMMVDVTDIKTGIALGLAASGLSELASKTGLHDLFKRKE
ncbi:MAG TPA: hypothetical protein HA362_03735 [Nanoarchaeota archaeon]|nr:hypothetical protein [Nanoarchaeota archaeon]